MEDMIVYVCTHKKCVIKNDKLYKPLLCGAIQNKGDFNYIKDNTGENISFLNPFYSELTGLYWIWKNSKSNIVGLCHYRRYFIKHIYGGYLYNEDIKKYLDKYDIIVAKKHIFTYSMFEQYCDNHNEKDLNLIRESIKKISPEYIPIFDNFFENNSFYPFSMFISEKILIDDYCNWLFPILKDFGENIDLKNYENDYQRRVFGFLAERLFNIWILYNKLKVKECYVKREEAKLNFTAILDCNYLRCVISEYLL